MAFDCGIRGILWAFYGFFISSVPVMLWNAVSDVLAVILIVLKLKYG